MGAPCLTADPRRARSPTIGAAVALVLVQGPNDVRRAEADLLAAAAAAAAAAEVAMIVVTVGGEKRGLRAAGMIGVSVSSGQTKGARMSFAMCPAYNTATCCVKAMRWSLRFFSMSVRASIELLR